VSTGTTGFFKEVLERGDEQYLNFNPETATHTLDVIGKHIYEFKQKILEDGSICQDNVPEIFMLLISYFEVQPELMKTEGLFRIAASLDKIDEL
jgi:hypothetical protein